MLLKTTVTHVAKKKKQTNIILVRMDVPFIKHSKKKYLHFWANIDIRFKNLTRHLIEVT